MNIKIVSDTKEFESLREVWDGVLVRSSDNNLFLTWEWLFTWWKYYGNDRKLNIIIIEDDGKIVGIFPLMKSSYRKYLIGFDVLENLSITDTDKSGVILTEKSEEVLAVFLSYLATITRNNNTIFRIKHIPGDSKFLEILRRQLTTCSNPPVVNERTIGSCPYIPLPPTWEEFFHSMKKKRRGNLRRARESLERDHKIEFQKAIKDKDISSQMGRMIEMHQRRWRQQGFSGVFADEKTGAFYTEVARLFAEKGWLDLSVINADERAASFVYGAKYDHRFYYILTAFDADYAEYSLGNLHIMRLVEESIENGLGEFDFLRGAEPYKVYWTKLARNNLQVLLTKPGFLAAVRLRLFSMTMLLNSMLHLGLLRSFRILVRKRRWQRYSQRLKGKQ